ncbi:MAG TPA: hypothetical protein VH306_05460 [Gaiellaceae bacterium]|jgi:hypothetical protein
MRLDSAPAPIDWRLAASLGSALLAPWLAVALLAALAWAYLV